MYIVSAKSVELLVSKSPLYKQILQKKATKEHSFLSWKQDYNLVTLYKDVSANTRWNMGHKLFQLKI